MRLSKIRKVSKVIVMNFPHVLVMIGAVIATLMFTAMLMGAFLELLASGH